MTTYAPVHVLQDNVWGLSKFLHFSYPHLTLIFIFLDPSKWGVPLNSKPSNLVKSRFELQRCGLLMLLVFQAWYGLFLCRRQKEKETENEKESDFVADCPIVFCICLENFSKQTLKGIQVGIEQEEPCILEKSKKKVFYHAWKKECMMPKSLHLPLFLCFTR